MADLFGKSPKMWVNEICVKQMVHPNWEVRETSVGPPPTFTCFCTISYADKVFRAQASGKTKKEAEQEAAREMLLGQDKLAMTQARLCALANASKKAKSSILSPTSNGSNEQEDLPEVSDNDDDELEKAGDPIGELLGTTIQHNLKDPVYSEVRVEGPPHKRIFSVSCTVGHTTLVGRRYKKQTAKKIAALRVLREVEKEGHKFTFLPLGRMENESSVEEISSSPRDTIDCPDKSLNIELAFDEIASHFNKMSLTTADETSPRNYLLKNGGRKYCHDESQKCLAYFADYTHAFDHLKKSETLDKTLGNPDFDIKRNSADYGGPLQLLVKISKEIGIKIVVKKAGKLKDGETLLLIRLTYPFNFIYKIPKVHAYHGTGATVSKAKDDVANSALQGLRLCFFHC